MTIRRINSPLDPAPWYALREYLVEAYSNPEMRALVELSLVAEAASRLPDERVPAHEYAAMLCTLIQRHSGVPSPEFWCQLANDRPLRQREIGKIKSAFSGSIREAAEARYVQKSPTRPSRWHHVTQQLLALGVAFVSLSTVTAYCNLPQTTSPTPAPSPGVDPSKPKILCKDGTRSPTCEESRGGCCSNHGGVLEMDESAAP